mmetsp:Transcript_33669/g.73503  ORF Transcript_33669/g.73503 Transcript_33669/m.73503 type:complete len:767 (+) Transcript_33669:456-2756(+)
MEGQVHRDALPQAQQRGARDQRTTTSWTSSPAEGFSGLVHHDVALELGGGAREGEREAVLEGEGHHAADHHHDAHPQHERVHRGQRPAAAPLRPRGLGVRGRLVPGVGEAGAVGAVNGDADELPAVPGEVAAGAQQALRHAAALDVRREGLLEAAPPTRVLVAVLDERRVVAVEVERDAHGAADLALAEVVGPLEAVHEALEAVGVGGGGGARALPLELVVARLGDARVERCARRRAPHLRPHPPPARRGEPRLGGLLLEAGEDAAVAGREVLAVLADGLLAHAPHPRLHSDVLRLRRLQPRLLLTALGRQLVLVAAQTRVHAAVAGLDAAAQLEHVAHALLRQRAVQLPVLRRAHQLPQDRHAAPGRPDLAALGLQALEHAAAAGLHFGAELLHVRGALRRHLRQQPHVAGALHLVPAHRRAALRGHGGVPQLVLQAAGDAVGALLDVAAEGLALRLAVAEDAVLEAPVVRLGDVALQQLLAAPLTQLVLVALQAHLDAAAARLDVAADGADLLVAGHRHGHVVADVAGGHGDAAREVPLAGLGLHLLDVLVEALQHGGAVRRLRHRRLLGGQALLVAEGLGVLEAERAQPPVQPPVRRSRLRGLLHLGFALRAEVHLLRVRLEAHEGARAPGGLRRAEPLLLRGAGGGEPVLEAHVLRVLHLAAEHLGGALGAELGAALLEAGEAGAPPVPHVRAHPLQLRRAQSLQRCVQADVLRALHLPGGHGRCTARVELGLEVLEAAEHSAHADVRGVASHLDVSNAGAE